MNIDETLEAAMADFFYAPDDVSIVDRPEITYAFAPRQSVLYNRVVRVRPRFAEPAELVDEVAEAHVDRPSRWHLNVVSDQQGMRIALEDAGYRSGHTHHGYVIDVDDYDRIPPDDVRVERVSDREGLIRLYEVRNSVFGPGEPMSDEDLRRELGQATGPHARVARFVAYRNGELAGIGGLTFFEDLDLAMIWAGGVSEEHRGHGVYTALLAERLREASRRGIRRVGLYARDSTSGPIVAAHGFERHGRMVTWDRPRSG